MRIAICTVKVPFVFGGAEACADGLRQALIEQGHEVEIITIPFRWYPPEEIVHQMLMWEMIDLSEANGKKIDRVIALKFPAYLVKHPNKVVWLIHQHRQAYDLWGTEYGEYIFCPSRLDALKRQHILVDAMALVKSNAECLILGEGKSDRVLRDQVERLHLSGKIKIVRSASDEEIISHYANSLAVFFGPLDEDYGFVTLESLYSGKPVITLTDSGGPLEFIRDGVNGLIVPPTPEAVANAIDVLFRDRAVARKMGQLGCREVDRQGLEWRTVAQTLLA